MITRPASLDEIYERSRLTPDGCREWMGARTSEGYGCISYGRRKSIKKAHRVAYEFAFGAIPDGYVLHHTCEFPTCVEVSHLELLTPEEHTRAHNPRHTSEACRRGHTGRWYVPPNGGSRKCLECQRLSHHWSHK